MTIYSRLKCISKIRESMSISSKLEKMMPKHVIFAAVLSLSQSTNGLKKWGCNQQGWFYGSFPYEEQLRTYDFDNNVIWNRFYGPTLNNMSEPIVRPWTKRNEFFVKSRGSSINQRVIVQIALKEKNAYNPPYFGLKLVDINTTMLHYENGFKILMDSFNCHVKQPRRPTDGYCIKGSENPRCCYGNDVTAWPPEYPPADECHMYQNTNTSKHSCLVQKDLLKYRTGCVGICHDAMILQLEFVPGDAREKANLYVGMISRKITLHQKRMCKAIRDPYCEYFVHDPTTEKSTYVRSKAFPFPTNESLSQNVTTFIPHEEYGFWMEWVPSNNDGPSLRIGSTADKTRDIVNLPFFGEEGMGGQWEPERFGWRGDSMKKPLMNRVFEPKAWTLQAVYGMSKVDFKMECSKEEKAPNWPLLGWLLPNIIILMSCGLLMGACCCKCPKTCCWGTCCGLCPQSNGDAEQQPVVENRYDQVDRLKTGETVYQIIRKSQEEMADQ